MCIYWKKKHTCGHTSDRPYIEMCKAGYFSNTVCSDIGEDNKARKSHFPCWPCIKGEARAEAEANAHAEREALVKAQEARELAIREKQAAEQRAKEERIRREAREKAAREREEEARKKAIKQMEQERAKKEGGLWIETGSGKKQKGRKGGGQVSGAGFPTMPVSAPPVLKTFSGKDKKENAGSLKMSPNKGLETGGRAGTWGPKKILSRKEGTAGMK
jgi:flagellar biosynthesis GTPase FlhF|tara:strand:+ start:5079 stop:5729 length:651 start_codon:yes stop_codon:yes gene_type:complete